MSTRRSVENSKTITTYELCIFPEYRKTEFTLEEKIFLRPIAETIAMLDGNAFFTITTSQGEWYEQYLLEAYALFMNNGGLKGWAGEVSWIKNLNLDNPAVKEAWDNFITISRLTKE